MFSPQDYRSSTTPMFKYPIFSLGGLVTIWDIPSNRNNGVYLQEALLEVLEVGVVAGWLSVATLRVFTTPPLLIQIILSKTLLMNVFLQHHVGDHPLVLTNSSNPCMELIPRDSLDTTTQLGETLSLMLKPILSWEPELCRNPLSEPTL